MSNSQNFGKCSTSSRVLIPLNSSPAQFVCPQVLQSCEDPFCTELRSDIADLGETFDSQSGLLFQYFNNNVTFSSLQCPTGFNTATTEEVQALTHLFIFQNDKGQMVGCPTLIWVINNGQPAIARINPNCAAGGIEIFQFPGITSMCRADTMCVFH